MANLARRVLTPEQMDDPALAAEPHEQALRGLARLNAVTGSDRLLWPAVRRLAATAPLRVLVLDLATGAGDVPVRLWERARRAGVPLRVEGCDLSPTALAAAERRARECGADVAFFRRDLLADGPPEGYDVFTCSLFLHHLTDEQALTLLRRMGERAKRAILVHDLRRGRLGLLAAQVVPRVLSRSPVVHFDASTSVRAAFTLDEVRRLAERAGLTGATVVPRWPFRFLLTWERP